MTDSSQSPREIMSDHYDSYPLTPAPPKRAATPEEEQRIRHRKRCENRILASRERSRIVYDDLMNALNLRSMKGTK